MRKLFPPFFAKRNSIAGLIAALCCFSVVAAAPMDSLRLKIEKASLRSGGRVGVAIELLETGDTLTFNGRRHFPMQSVFKFPLALAILHSVDDGHLSLGQKIHVTKSELPPGTWSPLREKYPGGEVDLTLEEILVATVSQSDNNGCDLLFRLIGGPGVVDEYIHRLGVNEIAIAANEEAMHRDWNVQYSNWSTPAAQLQLLKMVQNQSVLSPGSNAFLLQTMIGTSTGPRRIKGLLPAKTVVAHKTGSSGANDRGISAATNDVGIITLPDGRHLIIAVLVSDATAGESALESVIADIAKAAWDVFVAGR